MKPDLFLIAVPIILGLSSTAYAEGLPLQIGIYRVGSRYIQIAAKSKRLCYHGFSARSATVASIAPDSKHKGFYRVNGLKNTVLYQQSTSTLLIGAINDLKPYEADYSFPRDIAGDLQKCLESKTPFFSTK